MTSLLFHSRAPPGEETRNVRRTDFIRKCYCVRGNMSISSRMTSHIEPDPDVMEMLEQSAAPLCIICRASFRVGGGLLCEACRSEGDPPAPSTVAHQPAA